MLACAKKNDGAVKILLDAGASTTIKDGGGLVAMHHAMEHESWIISISAWLLLHGKGSTAVELHAFDGIQTSCARLLDESFDKGFVFSHRVRKALLDCGFFHRIPAILKPFTSNKDIVSKSANVLRKSPFERAP